jgi:hypothetical protein
MLPAGADEDYSMIANPIYKAALQTTEARLLVASDPVIVVLVWIK